MLKAWRGVDLTGIQILDPQTPVLVTCWIAPATPLGNSLSDMVIYSLTLQVPFLTHREEGISPQLSAFSLGGWGGGGVLWLEREYLSSCAASICVPGSGFTPLFLRWAGCDGSCLDYFSVLGPNLGLKPPSCCKNTQRHKPPLSLCSEVY